MRETKVFLGKEIAKQPHKIARELVAYMLQESRYFTLEQLEKKLAETNTRSNLKTRIKRCLTNTPDVVNERNSDQSRIFSIPMQYKNIRVLEKEGTYKLEVTNGSSPEIREEDYTQKDLEKYVLQKGMNKINVKKEFATWLLKNAPETYNYYLGSSTNTIIERLNEISAFFPNQNFFEVDTSNVEDLIKELKLTFSIKERRRNPDFIEYDKQNSNGIPKAVMGKNNYVVFLREKFGNTSEIAPSSKFTWVKTYTEIVNFIKDKKEDQQGLIQVLKDAGCDLFNDQEPKDNIIPLEVIDPFTFFCYLNKYFKQRLEILQKLSENLNFTIPEDDFGLPSTNPQKVWVFPYKYLRKNNEIDRLWSFFESVLDDNITEEQFKNILEIRGVANTKLTEILFYTNPVKYFPINGPTKPFLEQKFGIKPKFTTYEEYLDLLVQIKSQTKTPFYQLSHEAWLWNNQPTKEKSTTKNNKTMETPLNQLFYGPPGTGKTYGTIAEAIKIVDNDFFQANENNRKALTKRYQELLITDWKEANGQIAFCTFHQSFTYEDFVEGIKPKTTQNKDIYYDIEPGIFKRICDLADSSKSTTKVKSEGVINWSEDAFRRAYFYKLSLGEANNPDDKEIYEFCRDNGYVSIGFAGAHDLSGKSESQIKELCEEINEQTSAGSQLSTFIHGVSIGDYVLISKGNYFVRALGKVVGGYEYHDDYPIAYNHFRKVEWVFTDENIPIEEMYHTTLMQRSIYRIDHEKLKQEFFVRDDKQILIPEQNIKPYVLVIDEINRGNVASIFGELITLIEPDKRAGGDEELQVMLPYSKEKFSVPDNVYIIGTMNTADRSIEALDSALRRRFSFTEIKPNPSIINKVLEDKATWNSVSLSLLLETINKRITVLIDRDHQIGHSYFLKLKVVNEQEFSKALKAVFSDYIIPLLQEYFFNDYVKIGMVLGSGFIKITNSNDNLFADIEDSLEDDYSDAKDYEFVDLAKLNEGEFKEVLNILLNK